MAKEKKTRPEMPEELNGEHKAIWRMLDYLGEQMSDIRRFQNQMLLVVLGAAATIIGILIAK